MCVCVCVWWRVRCVVCLRCVLVLMSCNPAHVLVRLVVSLGAVLPPTALYAASSHNPIRRTTSSANRSSSRRPPPPTTTNHHQPPRRPRRWLAPASVHVQKTMFRKPRVFGQPHEQVVCTSSWIGWVRMYVRVVLECRARAGVRASTDGCCGCAMAVRRGMLCASRPRTLLVSWADGACWLCRAPPPHPSDSTPFNCTLSSVPRVGRFGGTTLLAGVQGGACMNVRA